MNLNRQIQLQIDRHRQINLLAPPSENGFHFIETTRELIAIIAGSSFSEEEEQALLLYTVKAVLSSLYRLNQFYQFDRKAEMQLATIYRQLLFDIRRGREETLDFETLARRHYFRLQQWLVETQPEALVCYPSIQPFIEYGVVCAEYSAATQLRTLGIGLSDLTEPVLDLGCGKEYHLVKFLHSKGIDAYGIDREVTPGEKILRNSWTDAAFQPGYWGTIISHLGFTNHFMHHHLKTESDHLLYAKKYVELLQALKIMGKFYYTPDLPFIEGYLDHNQYLLRKKQVAGTPFYAVSIKRLK